MLNYFKDSMIGQTTAVVTLIIVIVTFVYNFFSARRIRRQEIYQRLEFASIDLFKFEIQHSKKTWRLYDQNFNLAGMNEQAEREITNHITQLLNLFEMIIELHKNKIVDDEIFCTWLKWIFEIADLKTFQSFWEKDLRNHYTGSLGMLINYSHRIIDDKHIAKEDKFDRFTKTLCGENLACKSKLCKCNCLRAIKRNSPWPLRCKLAKCLDKCNKT